MRTSLNEIKTIEEHLFRQSDPAGRLLFGAHLILNAGLRDKVALQQTTYQTIQQYGRKQLKQEIEAAHQKLMNQPQGFMQRLAALFSKGH